MKRAVAAGLAIVIACAPLSIGLIHAGADVPKCKAPAHLSVTAAAAGASALDAKHVSIVRVASGSCKNAPTYTGPLYVFEINGRAGMQLFPSGAAYVREQFAARSGSVTLDHTVQKVLSAYRTFDDGARAKVAAELQAEGA